jgi:fructose-bisphosphate aldolase class I
LTLGPGTYTIEQNAYWSERIYSHVMRLLNEYDVCLEGILLKPNMIIPGLDAPPASPADVAKWTTRTMLRTIPAAVPGIHFLSGGMSEEESTLNLQALQEACPNAPWSLTFSYGRALQSATLKAWAGQQGNWDSAQAILVALAKANSQAQLGQFKGPHPVPGGGRILQALRTGGSGK